MALKIVDQRNVALSKNLKNLRILDSFEYL